MFCIMKASIISKIVGFMAITSCVSLAGFLFVVLGTVGSMEGYTSLSFYSYI